MLKVYSHFCNDDRYSACFVIIEKDYCFKNVYRDNFGINNNLEREKHHILG